MISGFVIGFVGSLHCIGMCGPLTLMMMGSRRSLYSFALYHLGRIMVYVLIGLLLGLIGHSIQLMELQKVITILLGAGLILLYGIPKIRNRIERFYYNSSFNKQVRKLLANQLSTKKRWFFSGIANGFLPCGLTYVAAAGAIVLPTYAEASLFMIAFGLGTIPALALFTITGSSLTNRFKKFIPNTISFIAILSGSLLLLRGLLITLPDFNQLVQANAAGLITVCGL
ncbi:MAG: sulfite exporter TauE/SafE family protein [Ekhidna sp.]